MNSSTNSHRQALRRARGGLFPPEVKILGTDVAGRVEAVGKKLTQFQVGDEVTGVDVPTKLDMLRSIGADHVIDYTKVDFDRNGERYAAILDMAAYRNVFKSRRSLATSGIYLRGGGSATFATGLSSANLAIFGRMICRSSRVRT